MFNRQRANGRARGVSLIEILVVVSIIGLLIYLIVPALAKSRFEARRVQCINNLRQLHIAAIQWDHDKEVLLENYPGRLAYLKKEGYVTDHRLFVCPNDRTRGQEGGKPAAALDQFKELDENPATANSVAYKGDWWDLDDLRFDASQVPPSSYLYEFSEATIARNEEEWETTFWYGHLLDKDGDENPSFNELNVINPSRSDGRDEKNRLTWQEVKMQQQQFGDVYLDPFFTDVVGYPTTWFPFLRCFWHQRDADDEYKLQIINISLGGNVFDSTPKWEEVAVEGMTGEKP